MKMRLKTLMAGLEGVFPPGSLIEVSNLYENREDTVVGQNISMLSFSERLLWPYRALSVE